MTNKKRQRPLRPNGGIARIAAALLSALVALPSLADAQGCFRGINLSGAEFGEWPGTFGKDYIYPSEDTIRYFVNKGFDTVRLPFKWEHLQPELNKPLDEAERDRLQQAVALMRQYGLRVILDPHNYAYYKGQQIGSADVPDQAFADFWKRLALLYKDAPDVSFGLMNEPFDVSAEQWLKSANAATAAIRETGARNLVLVPGTSWTGAHSWQGGAYGRPNAEVMIGFKDPANRFAFEVHQYLDDDFSGTKGNCSRADDAVQALETFGGWLRANRVKGYLGEFGVPGHGECVKALSRMVGVVERNRDIWTGWSYWVAGDWWPESEELNIQPTAAGDRPQLAGLASYLKDFSAASSRCPAIGN